MAKITSEFVSELKFPIDKKGYSQESVDLFMSKLVNLLNHYEKIVRDYEKNDYKKDALEYHRQKEALNKSLINAQSVADDLIKQANLQVEELLLKAKNEAEQIKQTSENEARALQQRATEQAQQLWSSSTEKSNELIDRATKDCEILSRANASQRQVGRALRDEFSAMIDKFREVINDPDWDKLLSEDEIEMKFEKEIKNANVESNDEVSYDTNDDSQPAIISHVVGENAHLEEQSEEGETLQHKSYNQLLEEAIEQQYGEKIK